MKERELLSTKRRPVAFLAGGQGSQFAGMGVPQFENDAVFRETMRSLLSGPRLSPILEEWLKGSSDSLSRSANTQPLLVALSIASARSLASRGVHPGALLGHSAGEFALAVFAGLIDDDEARTALELRSEILVDGPEGSMQAVRSSAERVSELINEHDLPAWVAADNSPTQCLVSAEQHALDRFAAIAQSQSILAVPALSDMPFHSPLLKAKSLHVEASLSNAKLSGLRVPLVSASTGQWVSDEESERAEFWAEQLWRPVKFWPALDTLLREDWVIVDLGPGTSLSAIASSHPRVRSGQSEVVSLMPAKGKNLFSDWVEKTQYIQKITL